MFRLDCAAIRLNIIDIDQFRAGLEALSGGKTPEAELFSRKVSDSGTQLDPVELRYVGVSFR